MSAHSIEAIIRRELLSENTDGMTADELFEKGFTAYRYEKSTFLLLNIQANVKTTCPINGSEDIIKVNIEYRVNKFGDLIEHHSFLNWLDTFIEKGFGLEATCSTIYEMVDSVVNPSKLVVRCTSHTNYKSINTATREKDF